MHIKINHLTHLFQREETKAQESSITLDRVYQVKTLSLKWLNTQCHISHGKKPLKTDSSIQIIEVRRGFLQKLEWLFWVVFCSPFLHFLATLSLFPPPQTGSFPLCGKVMPAAPAWPHPRLSQAGKPKLLHGGKSPHSGEVWLPARHSKRAHLLLSMCWELELRGPLVPIQFTRHFFRYLLLDLNRHMWHPWEIQICAMCPWIMWSHAA